LPISYYEAAVNELGQKKTNLNFFIFSDDISWCRENFGSINNVQFVVHDQPADASEDLLLMSACRHQIIANSTFSWWGAWLNDNPEKIVIAPKKWFGRAFTDAVHPPYASRYYNTKDLLPESWIKL